MLIQLDPHKGICFGSKVHSKPESTTNGFDQLPWDLHIPEPESTPEVKDVSVKSKKTTRKERKEALKQQKMTDRILRLHNPDDFNPYTAKQKIKKLHASMKSPTNCKLVEFGSIALYASDLEHLIPGEWLNDNNISLVYELTTSFFVKPHPFGHQIQLLYPSLVQLFLHYPLLDELHAILPKELAKLKVVFIPFSFIDADSVDMEDANNGDHWALCVLSVAEKKLYVFDSMSSEDDDDALLDQLALRLKSALFKPKDTLKVVKLPCDQQDNFDDCGVFLIMFTCYLVSQLMSEKETDFDLGKVKFNALSARLFMVELIHRLHRQ